MIKFSNDIKLDRWISTSEFHCFRKNIESNNLYECGVSISKLIMHKAFNPNTNIEKYMVSFFGPLYFLHPFHKYDITGTWEQAQEQVDQFLLRMSKLSVFL